MIATTKLLLVFALCALFASCIRHPLAGMARGKIYYRVVQDISNPSGGGCSPRASSYSDNNPGVPSSSGAHMSDFVGSLEPGEYSASYLFDGGQRVQFTYHLSAPEDGRSRYYTKVLKYYSSNLNRCVVGRIDFEDR